MTSIELSLNVFSSLQNDFYTLISWWLEAGIPSKMHSDTLVVLREEGFRGAYWSEPHILGNQQLHFIHIVPSIILCLGGLGISTIIFMIEVAYHKWNINKNRMHTNNHFILF